MALLFMDGFDHYGGFGISNHLNVFGKWSTASAGYFAATNNPTPRTGLGCCTAYYGGSGPSNEGFTNPLPASGGFVVGFAMRTAIVANGNNEFLRIKEGTAINHLSLVLTTANTLQVRCGATVLATGTTVLPINSWYYIEFKGIIDAAAGSFELRVDGVPEPNCVLTGVVTRNGGTGQWNCVGFSNGAQPTNFSTWFMDDLYICDQSGTLRNNFLGPVKIDLLMPQVGNGSNVGLTPSTGTDHGALVDEAPPNTTDYNSGATVGLKDTYNLANPTLNGGILGIQVNMYAAKSDVSARKVCSVVRAGGVDYDGTDAPLLTTFGYVSQPRAQNPNTSADWTVADVTALEAGMKVTV